MATYGIGVTLPANLTIKNQMNNDIETEIKNRFYRPTVSSVKLYRQRLKDAQNAAVKAPAARKWKFWSLLVTISALSAVAQAHA